MKKGFTLLELLAVIVILAVLALIVIPITSNVINQAKANIAKSSADGYISAVKNVFAKDMIKDNNTLPTNIYMVSELSETLEYKGKGPTEGWVYIKSGNVENYSLKFDDYYFDYNGQTSVKADSLASKPSVKYYPDGSPIYFNATDGVKCNKDDANSDTGTTDGCLKWYAFLDEDGKETVNLLLDHNTSAKANFNEDIKSFYPKWNETYNVRPISPDEVAKITHIDDWLTHYKAGEEVDIVYLDSGTNTPKSTCSHTDISECSYGWLYDHLSYCDGYGCLNLATPSETTTAGYWTSAKSQPLSNNNGWYVSFDGQITHGYTGYDGYGGMRPVITVSKILLN